MTYRTCMQSQMATAGAARRGVETRLSTAKWSIRALAAIKPSAHAVVDFGGNAIPHPRPEEAPL